MNNNTKAKIYAFITILFWSSSFMSIKLALQYHDSITVAVIRYFLASIILLIYMMIAKIPLLPKKSDLTAFFVSGTVGFSIYMITFNKAMETLSSPTGSVVLASAPIFTAIFSQIFLGEKINAKCWMSIFVSFVGIAILMLWEGVFSFNFGIFWMILSAILVATYNILQRKFTKKYSAMESTSYSILTGTILLVLYSPKAILKIPEMNGFELILMLHLSILVGIVGYIFWSKAFSLADSTGEIANFMFLNPFLATIQGIIFLGERITVATVVGGGILMLGLISFSIFKNK